MFRLFASLAFLLFCCLPVTSQPMPIVQADDEYVPFKRIYPDIAKLAVPPFALCAGFPEVTVETDGLSYALNLNAEGGLILYVFSESFPDETNPKSLRLTESCGGVEGFIFRVHTCKQCPRPKFNIKTKSAVLGVRG